MELLEQRPSLKAYYQLTKPGIVFGNAITAFGGFALASLSGIVVGTLFATLLGLCLIMASGCVSNNYLDRVSDQKMERTKNRALVTGVISLRSAKIFSLILCFIGTLFLVIFTNSLAVSVALFGLFVYLVLYSRLKYYSHHATLIGSIAGATPPVVGYCAVTNHLDLGALLLFAILVFWQMPHFYAIALYRIKDYAASSTPVLPLVKGVFATKVQMVLYTIAFICASLLLTTFHYAGMFYLIVSLLLGGAWLALCISGFKALDHTLWARRVFILSLIVITGISAAMVLNLSR